MRPVRIARWRAAISALALAGVVLVTAHCSSTSTAATGSKEDEAALLVLHRDGIAAHLQNDVDRLLAPESDDYVLVNRGEVVAPQQESSRVIPRALSSVGPFRTVCGRDRAHCQGLSGRPPWMGDRAGGGQGSRADERRRRRAAGIRERMDRALREAGRSVVPHRQRLEFQGVGSNYPLWPRCQRNWNSTSSVSSERSCSMLKLAVAGI